MKVCIITTVHPVFSTRIFHREAKTLARAGYDVTLVAQHDKNEIVDGVKIVALPKPRNRFSRIFDLTWRAFRVALRQRADIYHFHDPELLPIGLLLKLLTRAKVIYDVHEDLPQQTLTKYWIPDPLKRPLAMFFNLIEKLLAQAMDAVVVATEGIAAQFKGLKPLVVHNYPDVARLPTPPARADAEEAQERVVIYIGKISKDRGVMEMVKAMEHLTHINRLYLDLLGNVEPPGLEDELRTLPGWCRVRMYGRVPLEAAYKALGKADIGIVYLHPEPRFIISLPIKLFEYMAVGLPVVASNFPLWKDIVEGNQCGVTVNPLNPKAIAQAIEYLLAHPEEARCMGENGRRAVAERYNWESEGRKLVALYEQC